MQITSKRKGTGEPLKKCRREKPGERREPEGRQAKGQRKSKQSVPTLDSIQMSVRKTEHLQTSSKMETVVEGLESQGEVGGKALGVPLENTRTICSVIDSQRNGSSPTSCRMQFPFGERPSHPSVGF